MKLIDADKLIEICRKGWKLFGREDEKLKHWVDENDIREQPTVEAIPIEWIINRANELYQYSIGTPENDDDYYNRSIANDDAKALNSVLYLWREENERNKENTSQID